MKTIAIILVIPVGTTDASTQPVSLSPDIISKGLDLAEMLSCGIFSLLTSQPRSQSNDNNGILSRQSSTMAFHSMSKILPSLVLTTEKLAKECLGSSTGAARRRFRRSYNICPDITNANRHNDVMKGLTYLADVGEGSMKQKWKTQEVIRNISESMQNIHWVTVGEIQRWATILEQQNDENEEIMMRQHNETQALIATAAERFRQIMMRVQETLSSESDKINSNLNSLRVDLRSVIADVLRDIKIEDCQDGFTLINAKAKEYFEHPNIYALSQLRAACAKMPPTSILIHIKNRFSNHDRFRGFYLNLEFSNPTIEKALAFFVFNVKLKILFAF